MSIYLFIYKYYKNKFIFILLFYYFIIFLFYYFLIFLVLEIKFLNSKKSMNWKVKTLNLYQFSRNMDLHFLQMDKFILGVVMNSVN
jgi:hypothetical protein